jgi:1,4-alpha-glucan branching enzyme
MPTGYFALVLHAHLPFVRHPEDPTVMEEQWLYEAITGTYLPLIQMFEGLLSDHVPYRVTVSLSAPLITMLTDDLLKLRYAEHLDKLIELTEKEIDRTKPEPHYNRLAHMYHDRFSRCATPGAATRATWCARSATCSTPGASR